MSHYYEIEGQPSERELKLQEKHQKIFDTIYNARTSWEFANSIEELVETFTALLSYVDLEYLSEKDRRVLIRKIEVSESMEKAQETIWNIILGNSGVDVAYR